MCTPKLAVVEEDSWGTGCGWNSGIEEEVGTLSSKVLRKLTVGVGTTSPNHKIKNLKIKQLNTNLCKLKQNYCYE